MIEKIKEKWDEILLHIKEEHELTDVSFKTWLLPTQPYSMKDGTLQILVPDVQFLGYIKKKYGLLIQITIEELTGIECEVDFVTIEQVDEPQKETDKSHLINPPVLGQPPAHPGCELKSALHIRHLRRRREQ